MTADFCIDCDGAGTYPSGADCLSCGGTGLVLAGEGIPIPPRPLAREAGCTCGANLPGTLGHLPACPLFP